MNNHFASFVICFEKHLAKDVHQHFTENELITIDENETHILVEINKGKTDDVSKWLDTTCKIIDYDNHQSLYAQHDGSILHLYLSVMNPNDKAKLAFCANHLVLFEKLATVIDLDYGVLFEH